MDQKTQILDPFHFHENSNPSNVFWNNVFVARVLSLMKISAILDNITGNKGPKSSQNRLFLGCWIGTQIVENF